MERFFLSHSLLGSTKPYPDRSAGRVGNFWTHIQQTPSQGILGMGLWPCHKKSSKRPETTRAYVAKKCQKVLATDLLNLFPRSTGNSMSQASDCNWGLISCENPKWCKPCGTMSRPNFSWILDFWEVVDFQWCWLMSIPGIFYFQQPPKNIMMQQNRARPLTAKCRAVLQELLLRQIKGLVAALQEKTPKSQA